MARLAETPRIIGLKDATGDATRVARLRARVGEGFRLLSGDDATAPGFLAQGGDGCISVTSNLAPGLCRTLYLQAQRPMFAVRSRGFDATARPVDHGALLARKQSGAAQIRAEACSG